MGSKAVVPISYTVLQYKDRQSYYNVYFKTICISWIILQDIKFNEPRRIYKETEIKKMKMKYYNSEIHKASFVIPQFAKEVNVSELS